MAKATTKVVKPKGKPGRPPSVRFKPGDMVGYLRIVRLTQTKDGPRWITECRAPNAKGEACGKREKVPTQYLTRTPPKTNCGCQTYKDSEAHLAKTKICWQMMHTRCEYKGHVAYEHYGGRGITICQRWHKSNPDGWHNFLADMGERPVDPKNPKVLLSLDRIDPDGNYELHKADGTLQCRWADKTTQSRNQRRYK